MYILSIDCGGRCEAVVDDKFGFDVDDTDVGSVVV